MDRDDSIRENRSGSRNGDAVVEPSGVGRGASWSGHERNHLWMNLKGQDFLELSGISAVDVPYDSRTFSLFDFDHDGFQDFVLVNANRPLVQVYRNRFGDLLPDGQRGQSIHLRLEGGHRAATSSDQWSNRDAIGARILVDLGDQTLLREYRCGEGLGAQNSRTLNIGIGVRDQVRGIEILWPSGKRTQVGPVPAGALISAREDIAEVEIGVLEPLADAPTRISTKDVSLLPTSPELRDLLHGKTSAKVSLVVSWYTTCAACKRVEPTLAAIQEAFAATELEVFGFNNSDGDSKKEMERYRERFKPSYTMLIDRTEADIKAFKSLQDAVLPAHRAAGKKQSSKASDLTPSSLLLDGEGHILKAWIGVPTVSELKHLLSEGR